jgi:hypothetical protein
MLGNKPDLKEVIEQARIMYSRTKHSIENPGVATGLDFVIEGSTGRQSLREMKDGLKALETEINSLAPKIAADGGKKHAGIKPSLDESKAIPTLLAKMTDLGKAIGNFRNEIPTQYKDLIEPNFIHLGVAEADSLNRRYNNPTPLTQAGGNAKQHTPTAAQVKG